jgi:hypothetical protein
MVHSPSSATGYSAGVLTEYQLEVAGVVSNVTGSKGFALAGGAALIIQGVVDRPTGDLDFFARESNAVNRVCPDVESALRSTGMTVTRLVDAAGFIRLHVSRDNESCEVDLGHDTRLDPEVQTSIGPAVSIEELAADKTLALFGRAEARDFVDVFALAKLLGEDRLCELAAHKDRGFTQRHFAEALGAFSRLDREEFDVDVGTFFAIRQWSNEWRSRLVARELQPDDPGTSRSRNDDLGLEL